MTEIAVDRNIGKAEVRLITCLSDVTIWREMQAKRFPQSFRISDGRMAATVADLLTDVGQMKKVKEEFTAFQKLNK